MGGVFSENEDVNAVRSVVRLTTGCIQCLVVSIMGRCLYDCYQMSQSDRIRNEPSMAVQSVIDVVQLIAFHPKRNLTTVPFSGSNKRSASPAHPPPPLPPLFKHQLFTESASKLRNFLPLIIKPGTLKASEIWQKASSCLHGTHFHHHKLRGEKGSTPTAFCRIRRFTHQICKPTHLKLNSTGLEKKKKKVSRCKVLI